MARYNFTVRRGDKIITKCGVTRFFNRSQIVISSRDKPVLVRAGDKKQLTPNRAIE